MARPAVIPTGAWPALLAPELAAGYVGEVSVEAFEKNVGELWSYPVIVERRKKRWRRMDLERDIARLAGEVVESEDLADEL